MGFVQSLLANAEWLRLQHFLSFMYVRKYREYTRYCIATWLYLKKDYAEQ